MKKTILISLCFLMFCSFADNNQTETNQVSIINLIATPEKYDGQAVCVEGYYLNDFEDQRLYLDEVSARNRLSQNSISLIVYDTIDGKAIRLYNQKYIRVKGYFKKAPPNNINTYGDNIRDIFSIETTKPPRW